MTERNNQLTETFSAHEDLAPDAAEVLEKAHGIARSYQRRRWVVRATGGAVLTAAVVAGSVGVAGEIGNAGSTGSTASTGAAFLSSGDSSPAPATYTEDQEMTAYFEAGYDYDNAVALAKLWNSSDVISVKASAGLKLLEGETLPVSPNGSPATPDERAQDAFFGANYDYNDAVALGALWHMTDINKVKIKAGTELEAGDTLPIAAGSAPAAPVSSSETAAQVAADNARAEFFAQGYTYNDAVKLATLWKESDPWQVKAEAGKKLLNGDTLPIGP
jgi:hypothetical protein